MRKLHLALALSAIMVLAVGCGGSSGQATTESLPKWFKVPPKGCGTGTAKVRSILGLARDAAVSRARADLAGYMRTKVEQMIRDYQASGEAEGKDFDEELVKRVSRQITEATLVGTRVAATDISGNNFFALVCLDLDTFANAIDSMNRLDKRARKALEKRAEAEFKNLDEQLKRLHEQND